jgi:hypothetical protein
MQDTPARRPQEGANFIDRAGQRYGKMVAVRRAEDRPVPYVRKNGRAYGREVQWLCVCDCGAEKVMTANALRCAMSCGCARREPRPNYRRKDSPPAGPGCQERGAQALQAEERA